MSLWTPYDPEQAVLDLSKSAASLKTELSKPATSLKTEPESPRYQCPPGLAPELQPYKDHGYQYQQRYYNSSPLLSPSSLHTSQSSLYGEYSPPASSPDSVSGRATSGAKLPRPFKAVTAAMPECGTSADPDPSYAAFRAAMLEAMRARNGGSLTVSNPRMRRSVHRSSEAGAGEDADYLERRARNNAAAKRSRDLRKQKEDELAIRVAYLERQNSELRDELAALSRPPPCLTCLNRYSPY